MAYRSLDRANLSGRVTSLSTTVPLGGLEGFPFILHNDHGNSPRLLHTRPRQTLPEESGVDSLADNDVGELEVSLVDAGGLEALLDSLDLVLQHVVDLPITHSIPARKIILQILTSDNKTIYTNS